MSPFARGLLGGVAQGVTDTASLLFQDAIAARKEERLAKIADRNYLRDRADQLSDMDRNFREGKELIEIEQEFKTSEREGSQDFTREMAGLTFTQKKEFEKYVRENFAQSKFGQQFADLERVRTEFGEESEQFKQMNKALQLQLQQVIPTKDYLGNTSYGIITYGDDGSVSVQQIDFESPTGLSGGGGSGGASGAGQMDFSGISDDKFQKDLEVFRNAKPGPDGNYYLGGQRIPEAQYKEMLKTFEEELRRRQAAAGQARYVPGQGQMGRAS